MSAVKKPVLFRAVHTKTRWRKARHETLANARSQGNRSARALFRGENDAIDLTKHGEPLYVVIWSEEASKGEIIKPTPQGDRSEPVAIEDIVRWENARGAADEEFERYFQSASLLDKTAYDVAQEAVCIDPPGEVQPEVVATEVQSSTDTFAEGGVVFTEHARRERNSQVRDMLLADRRRKERVECELCGKTSAGLDPRFGEAIFEAHHLIPLADGTDRQTGLADMALLCACCHRLIHRAISVHGAWMTIEQAKIFVRKNA